MNKENTTIIIDIINSYINLDNFISEFDTVKNDKEQVKAFMEFIQNEIKRNTLKLIEVTQEEVKK